jgi:hypothetical protein
MDHVNAINVYQFLKEKYNNIKIRDQWIFKFDAGEERWETEAKRLIEEGKKPGFLSVRGVAKTLAMGSAIDEYWNKNLPNAIRVSGMTSNPPVEEMKKYGFYDTAERRRDKGQNLKVFNGRVYEPLKNVDKKFIAGVYKEHNLMDELFYLTGSCVASPLDQNWTDTACGSCWWCKEKYWAFGEY